MSYQRSRCRAATRYKEIVAYTIHRSSWIQHRHDENLMIHHPLMKINGSSSQKSWRECGVEGMLDSHTARTARARRARSSSFKRLLVSDGQGRTRNEVSSISMLNRCNLTYTLILKGDARAHSSLAVGRADDTPQPSPDPSQAYG
jgi:hypothetical protein